MSSRTRRTIALYLMVQFLPVAFLALVYQEVGDRLAGLLVGGVPLSRLLLVSAVTTPLLSQLLSGALFRAREGIADRALATVAVVRAFPRALLIAFVPVLVIVLAIAQAQRLGDGTSALVVVIAFHLLLAASLVPAYAEQSAWKLALAWGAYGVALMAVPAVWWLPTIAGIATQLVVLLPQTLARVRIPVPYVSTRSMLAATGRSVASSFPLWSLPFALFLLDRSLDAGLVFTALIPGVLAYQAFFATVAGPLWQRLDVARRQLSELSCDRAEPAVQDLERRGVIGAGRILGILVLSALVLVPAVLSSGWSGTQLFLLTALAGATSALAIASACRWAMLKTTTPSTLLFAILLLEMAIVGHLGPATYLALHAATCGVFAIVVGALNAEAWRRPGHAMFWRTALRQ